MFGIEFRKSNLLKRMQIRVSSKLEHKLHVVFQEKPGSCLSGNCSVGSYPGQHFSGGNWPCLELNSVNLIFTVQLQLNMNFRISYDGKCAIEAIVMWYLSGWFVSAQFRSESSYQKNQWLDSITIQTGIHALSNMSPHHPLNMCNFDVHIHIHIYVRYLNTASPCLESTRRKTDA